MNLVQKQDAAAKLLICCCEIFYFLLSHKFSHLIICLNNAKVTYILSLQENLQFGIAGIT